MLFKRAPQSMYLGSCEAVEKLQGIPRPVAGNVTFVDRLKLIALGVGIVWIIAQLELADWHAVWHWAQTASIF